MKLQVKELIVPEFSQTVGKNGNVKVANDGSEAMLFSCVFNRELTAEDSGSLTIKTYDEEGTLQETHTLNFTYNNMNEENRDILCFELTLPENYGDDTLYMQVYIDDSNTIIFDEDSSVQEATIKKIYFRAQPEITNFYWSSTEEILNGNQRENEREKIYKNEDAFLHIKGKGLKGKKIEITVIEEDIVSDDIIYKGVKTTLEGNLNVFTIKMSDIIAKYKLLHNVVGFAAEGDELELKARIKVEGIDSIAETSLLLLEHDKNAEAPIKSTNTGLVITLQGNVEQEIDEDAEEEENVEYTDFEIGLVAELKSSGKIVQGPKGSLVHGAVLVYPFNFYRLRLKDMIDCEIITENEAREMTLNPNNPNTLYTEEEMLDVFNKYKKLGDENTSIAERLADNTDTAIIGSSIVKKILDHVKNSNPTPVYTYNVCRDAWQTGASGASVRPDERYYKNGAECPPGGYFLNYQVGTYEVYFSNLLANRNNREIKVGTNPSNRSGLAIHQGCSYFSTGCTTLNTNYSKDERKDFVNDLYNAKLNDISNQNAINKKRLILVLIEERNALLVTNYQSRWYDPVLAPGSIIRSINTPAISNITLGNVIEISLTLNKETVNNYSIPKEEKDYIRWKYKVAGVLSSRDIPNSNGRESCTLTINKEWAQKELTITVYVALIGRSRNESDNNETICSHDKKEVNILLPKKTEAK